MSLDDMYGPLVSPGQPRPGEATVPPLSLSKLDHGSAALIRRLVRVAPHDCRVGECLTEHVPMLWVIDREGTFWFALEDVVDARTFAFRFPRPRQLRLAADQVKLGHPALVGGRPARIGGELCFSSRQEDNGWILSNQSGRYGLNCDRRRHNLENAGQLLDSFGIRVKPIFLES